MKKFKMLLVAIFGLFAFNIIAMAQCSDQQGSSNYSIDADDGTKYCSTLSDAFSEVKDNGTITVLKNDTISSSVVLRGNKTVTIDLAGKTISGSASNYLIAMLESTVTIKDSGNGGKISHSSNGVAFFAASGTLNLDGGILETSGAKAAVQVGQETSSATMNITGGTIENKSTGAGFALYVINGTATLNDGLIKSPNDNTVAVGGYNEEKRTFTTGSLIVNGGTIKNTSTTDKGLAIIITKGTVDINDGEVTTSANQSAIQSGALNGSDEITLTIDGGKIENTGNGAAILIARGNTTINKGSVISDGTYSTIQVGSSKDYHGHLTISGGTVENKKNIPAIIVPFGGSDATINGGVIKINEDDATSTNDTAIIVGMNPSTPEAQSQGYGSGAKVTITNGNITGGISLFGQEPELTISGGNITARSFAVSGNGSPEGNVNATINSTINITGGNLTSTSNAAIYHPQKGNLSISGGTITGKIGIVARQGKINITDGKITATGSENEKVRVGDAKENGAFVQLPTGTAIIVDNSEESYKEEAKVTVSGVDAIIDGESQSILSYKGEKQDDFEITGGTFLSKGIKDDVKEFINNTEYGQSQSGLVGKVHDITFEYDHSQGTVESYTDATEKEEVTFTVKPNEDYAVDSIEIKTEDNKNVQYTSSNNKHTFVMPEKDVTVSIKFKVLYADYSDLYEALLKAKGIDTSKYTKESIKALLEAIANAEKIEKGLRASQQYRINNLTYALNNAIANLVLVNSNAVKPSEPIPDTYDNGSIYFGFAIITLGTMLISIKKLRNN